MLTLHGKDFRMTRHAADGAIAEDLDERDVFELVSDHAPSPRLGAKQVTQARRGRRTIIVRWVEREHGYYVLNVSATHRR